VLSETGVEQAAGLFTKSLPPRVEKWRSRRFCKMICPICNGPTHRLFQKYGYWIRECSSCGHRFAEIDLAADHVGQVYGDQYFQGGAGYLDYLAEGTILAAHGKRYARLLERYVSPGTLLDVGAAAGFMLKGFIECGWTGASIEPNPRMAEHARTHLGLQVQCCSLEEFQSGECYDLISMIQVVPHFYDLRRALQAAAQHTRPGGHWLIETWNRASWTARLFGQNWHEYSPPSVLHWFSPEGLQRLAAQFAFREVARGRPAKWISIGHAESILRYKLAGSALGNNLLGLLRRLPSSLAIPYPADDLFWVLYEKAGD
jgi:SAM-dependent methyltransferase